MGIVLLELSLALREEGLDHSELAWGVSERVLLHSHRGAVPTVFGERTWQVQR